MRNENFTNSAQLCVSHQSLNYFGRNVSFVLVVDMLLLHKLLLLLCDYYLLCKFMQFLRELLQFFQYTYLKSSSFIHIMASACTIVNASFYYVPAFSLNSSF